MGKKVMINGKEYSETGISHIKINGKQINSNIIDSKETKGQSKIHASINIKSIENQQIQIQSQEEVNVLSNEDNKKSSVSNEFIKLIKRIIKKIIKK